MRESDGAYECQLGHRVTSERLTRSADLKLSEALWMAVQALDNEADVLRVVGGSDAAGFADAAEEQAKLLRDFARRHAPRVNEA
ncbi:MAG TPA: hypothetical protein VMY88_02115 [Acidimicrobiales bacterium]|nr:hypothetical protein [Acidimicrobiales bacterium]